MLNSNDLFLLSALQKEGEFISNSEMLKWMDKRRAATKVEIELMDFKDLSNWEFENVSNNLVHSSGKFFSIQGVEVFTNVGPVSNWTQPIINQPEIGFLGFITKQISGVLHFLIQAKIEPGNINFVQLSPTLQATKSNYQKVHKGQSPKYLEYFNGTRPVNVLLDQLQSEQGARFYKKRNRNIIVEVQDEIIVDDHFCWLTLGQIKQLMKHDNLVNMDTRTVISGINFGEYNGVNSKLINSLVYKDSRDAKGILFLDSAISTTGATNSIDEIISWITNLKSTIEFEVNRINLGEVKNWEITKNSIHHVNNKYFSVIAAKIHIGNREVKSWYQPLVKSAQDGLIAFIVKKINGRYHFLVQAKVEAGNFDIIELAPTVQCLTGNYRKGYNDYEVPFIDDVLNCPKENILYKSMQSEEGGRFYKEQNLNVIIEVPSDRILDIPDNYCWMTLNQMYTFIRFNNYINIQARSLISSICFN